MLATAPRAVGLLGACVGVMMMIDTVPGCALHQAYSRCGLRGCAGDAQITAEVRQLLAAHPALDPPNSIRVQTLDHVVYLTGEVSTDLQREIAGSAAAQASGAKRVVNSIAITFEGR